jgi:outer membrane protein assembly factor BamE
MAGRAMRYHALIITHPKHPHSMMFSHLVRKLALTLCCVALLPLGGCIYRMTIQQGNYLQRKSFDQLQVGMTRSQVRYLLGTPMVPSTFDNDRWDYLYYLKKGRIHAPQQYLVTVFFESDKVSKIDTHGRALIDSQPIPLERAPRPAT